MLVLRSSMALAAVLACAACSSSAHHTPAGPAAAHPTSSASAIVATPPTSPPTSPPKPQSSPVEIPPISAQGRAAGFVDVRTVVPDAIVDLRYATTHNFVGARLYPTTARCLVHESMVAGLRTAAQQLRRAGFRLVFWDCYRPHSVQVRMFDVVPNANWVARPGPYSRSHEAGRSVDVTLAYARTVGACPTALQVQSSCLLDMGTDFDDFTPRAYAYATGGVTAQERVNRAALRLAMSAGGLSMYSGEWWHFNGPGAGVERPIIDVAPY